MPYITGKIIRPPWVLISGPFFVLNQEGGHMRQWRLWTHATHSTLEMCVFVFWGPSLLAKSMSIIGVRKNSSTTLGLIGWGLPFGRPNNFRKNAYETCGGAAGPPLPTSSPPKGFELGLGLGLSNAVSLMAMYEPEHWTSIFYVPPFYPTQILLLYMFHFSSQAFRN